MGRFFPVATGVLFSLVVGCERPELWVPLRPAFLSLGSLESLAYPEFLADPALAATYRQRGLRARQQANFSEAVALLKTAVALAPSQLSGHVLLGWTQHLAGQRPAAIATLTRALDRDDQHVPAMNALGIVYLVEGQVEQAIATHTQAKTLQADNEIAYYNLSLAYERLPDMEAAIAHGERATELEPYNPHPWVALALAHWRHQDPGAAIAAYQQAIRLDGRYRLAFHLEHLAKAGFSPVQIETVEDIRQATPSPVALPLFPKGEGRFAPVCFLEFDRFHAPYLES